MALISPAPQLALPNQWEYSAPLISPEERGQVKSHAQKDPTVVFFQGLWHVFMTIRSADRTFIEYASFADWAQAEKSKRTVLELSETSNNAAPQAFYYSPHKLWYLIYQSKPRGGGKLRVAYSTTSDLANPRSWSQEKLILDGGPLDPRVESGLDFWVICDEQKAYLFFTSLNGKLWRAWTPRAEFPMGFRDCQIALTGPFFEASHTYRLKGSGLYLTLIEEDHRRHYKSYVAERLDGPWTPLAVTEEKPFAGFHNIRPAPGVAPWTDNISHGELLREGVDETLVVDPNNIRFLFQGMLEKEKEGLPYTAFRWRLGLLTPLPKK